tara:strand:- start:995 stop:1474 length:480 start_codon:yes stop_codon:yes gene_type:complete
MPHQRAKLLDILTSLQSLHSTPSINAHFLNEYIATLPKKAQIVARDIRILTRDVLLNELKQSVNGDVGDVLLKFSMSLNLKNIDVLVLKKKVLTFSPEIYVVYFKTEGCIYQRFETVPTLEISVLEILVQNYYAQGLATNVSPEEFLALDALPYLPMEQ